MCRKPEARAYFVVRNSGMKVGDDDPGPDIEQVLEVRDRLLEIAEIPVFVEVAQELAGHDVAVLIDGNGVFELSAERQDLGVGLELCGNALGVRDVAAGPAQEKRAGRRRPS